jgi:ketosteroid isomerase-like protein
MKTRTAAMITVSDGVTAGTRQDESGPALVDVLESAGFEVTLHSVPDEQDEIARLYGNVFRFMTATESATESLRMSTDGSMAFAHGRVTNVFGGAAQPQSFEGKFLLVWLRDAEGWRVAAYSVSSNES